MRLLLCTIIAFSTVPTALAQTNTGNASANGMCSQANSYSNGNNNRFIINCGIGKQQGAQMIAILNKILANTNQLPAGLVLSKLDEILRHVNPNETVTTYNCRGLYRKSGPSPTAAVRSDFGMVDEDASQRMFDAFRDLKGKELIEQCESLSAAYPEWLTPVLFCAVGYERVGKYDRAEELLKIYNDRSGPGYKEDKLCEGLYEETRDALQGRKAAMAGQSK